MSVEIRTASSNEMKKNIMVVKQMAGRMGFDENMGKVNWKAVRTLSGIGYKFVPKKKGVSFSSGNIGGVKCLMAKPDVIETENIIMYIHGGGFVSGSAESSKGYCSMLADCSKRRIIAVDYSLSPESRYPVALEECFRVYSTLCRRFPGIRIALTGESAGGNLCLALTNKIADNGLPKPSAVIVHSPVVDFSGSMDRTMHEINDFTVKLGCLAPLHEIYVGNGDSKSPYISPIYGDFSGFPPLFITCDSNETLYADSYSLYQKASESGVNVRMIEMKNSFHAFAAVGGGSPETDLIMQEGIDLIKAGE